MTTHDVDLTVCIIANLINLLMIGIFLARAIKQSHVEFTVGLVLEVLTLPLIMAVLDAAGKARQIWFIVLPLPMIAFLITELVLDYILKADFRHKGYLWLYLLIYYLGLLGMIGYAFLVSAVWGFVTLSTYFLNLLATWYSYQKVGHG